MMGDIQDTYQEIDKMLSAIDRKNSAHVSLVGTDAIFLNTGRIARKVNRNNKTGKVKDTDVENLSLIMEDLPLFQQSYVDEYSLFTFNPREKGASANWRDLNTQISSQEMEQELKDFKDRLKNIFSHRK